jgi:quinol monooxygenase YgiN
MVSADRDSPILLYRIIPEEAAVLALRFKAQIQPERIEEALAAFAAVVEPSRQTAGVVSFDVARDALDPNTILAFEVFDDHDARARQEALPEVANVMTLLPTILAAPPEATVFEVASASDAFATA